MPVDLTMNETILRIAELLPCCSLASVPISALADRERCFFSSFMPKAATAIVLAHHVVTEEEWTWYAIGNGREHCAADDHARNVCMAIKNELEKYGHDTRYVKYPGESGLQFRFVAEAAGLGVIGTNAFLFHPLWGPWVHLRVIGTTAELDLPPKLSGDQFCDGCNVCISECPAQAISTHAFHGRKCRSYRKSKGEYEPHGPESLLPYCKRCILICPKGKCPVPRMDFRRNR